MESLSLCAHEHLMKNNLHLVDKAVQWQQTQQSKQWWLSLNVDRALFPQRNENYAQPWCDRWLMGHCTVIMHWSFIIKCHLHRHITLQKLLSPKHQKHNWKPLPLQGQLNKVMDVFLPVCASTLHALVPLKTMFTSTATLFERILTSVWNVKSSQVWMPSTSLHPPPDVITQPVNTFLNMPPLMWHESRAFCFPSRILLGKTRSFCRSAYYSKFPAWLYQTCDYSRCSSANLWGPRLSLLSPLITI